MNKILTLFIFVVSLQVVAFAQEPNEGDIQVWNETKVYFLPYSKDIKGKKTEIFSPHFIGNLRVGQDVRHFVSERVGFGADIRLNDYFKFTPSYLYIAEQATKNAKSFEHRLRFDLTGTKKFGNWSFSDRNRIEHRIRNSKADSTRYRNKAKLAYTFKNSDKKEIVTPFVADEPFYDFSKKEWSRNEFSAGVGKKLTSNFSAEFFYMLQSNTGNTLKRVNIVGANFKISLK
ncbi:MAG: DUF2490 domain-containing protein [Pyrinomonadaceae bacterium]